MPAHSLGTEPTDVPYARTVVERANVEAITNPMDSCRGNHLTLIIKPSRHFFLPKKQPKKASENDNILFSNAFFNLAFVLL